MKKLFKKTALAASLMAATAVGTVAHAAPSAEQPNILVIMADDVGYWNVSAYHLGMMGYNTPNIDRIANEGALFTDLYAQQTSTAGRSAFILGQMPYRTGLTKVGMPGSDKGISEEDPTFAQILRDMGYTTGQFGKNHLGERDEFLPTNHGFDEFFGNLYHLNAEEEPEMPDFPDTVSRPRGVIRSSADGKIEDTGPLTRKRMETVDAEFMEATKEFIDGAVEQDKPFFAWFNPSRMHHHTRLAEKWEGSSGGYGLYADGMMELDSYVGELLDQLDDLGVADNTIVMFTTDNGFQLMGWPDAGMAPFRGEKTTGWEGGFRVPGLLRWPDTIEPGSRFNDIVAMEDFFPTFVSAAGNPNIKEQLLDGVKSSNGREYNVHLDGYNLTDYLSGKEEESPRDQFWYFSDDGDLLAVRNGRYKLHFMIQEAENGMEMWYNPFTRLRTPKLYDLKIDPFERADAGWGVNRYRADRPYMIWDVMGKMQPIIESFAEYPQRMAPASFTIDDALEAMSRMASDTVNK